MMNLKLQEQVEKKVANTGINTEKLSMVGLKKNRKIRLYRKKITKKIKQEKRGRKKLRVSISQVLDRLRLIWQIRAGGVEDL
jgi:hypothetical protein